MEGPHPGLWQPVLAGPMLLARPLAPGDYDALYAAASDPLIWEQHPDRLRYMRERFDLYFRSGLESKGALAVLDRSNGEIVGSSRFLDHQPGESSVEIGYTFLARRCWGTGANAELKRLMLDYAFRTVDAVFFLVGRGNLRSRRAVEKLGACEFARKRPLPPGAGDTVVYRLDKRTWLGR